MRNLRGDEPTVNCVHWIKESLHTVYKLPLNDGTTWVIEIKQEGANDYRLRYWQVGVDGSTCGWKLMSNSTTYRQARDKAYRIRNRLYNKSEKLGLTVVK